MLRSLTKSDKRDKNQRHTRHIYVSADNIPMISSVADLVEREREIKSSASGLLSVKSVMRLVQMLDPKYKQVLKKFPVVVMVAIMAGGSQGCRKRRRQQFIASSRHFIIIIA
ncbi:unnamed protein product [Camellia sinensis]